MNLGPDDTARSTPFASTAHDAARVLADLAIERATRRDADAARQAIEDAELVLEGVEDVKAAARIRISIGEAFLELRETLAAQERFEHALETLGEDGPVDARARALLGVARALAGRREGAARAAFEEAGLLYEDLGDEERVIAIDRELRTLEAAIEESPRSFSSSHRISVVPARSS